MLDSPRSASPTSPTPEDDSKAWAPLYFCRFPGCNKGYASTDGVRKHCRKHHADWLADLDSAMRENNQKHSAANYCSTCPAEPAHGEFAAVSHAPRKRQRADSGSSSISQITPNGTPRLDPTAPPRPEPPTFIIEPRPGALKALRAQPPTKEDIFNGVTGWPTFGEEETTPGARPHDAPDRPLLSALAALDERSSAWPHKTARDPRAEEPARGPLSQNFFSLGSGMPVPKRGYSLTSEAMAELARECELDAQRSAGGLTELADLNTFLREDAPDPSSPEHRDSVGFIADVWA